MRRLDYRSHSRRLTFCARTNALLLEMLSALQLSGALPDRVFAVRITTVTTAAEVLA